MTQPVHLMPREGHAYRDPTTQALIPPEGAMFDPNDLDTARAIACGDLVPAKAAKAAKAEPVSASKE